MEQKLMLAAGIAALSGFGLTRLYLVRFEREATGGPRVSVLVVARDSRAGTTLERAQLSQRELPEAYVDSRHVLARAIEDVVGARLALPVRAGEALLYTDLSSVRESTRLLSSLVSEGKRAFSLSARNASFDALLAPGDRVDVLLARPAAAGEFVTQNALVLAVGEDLGGSAPLAGHAGRADQVTLSLTPLESLRVAEAEQRGPLRLIVRNPDDLASDRGDPP